MANNQFKVVLTMLLCLAVLAMEGSCQNITYPVSYNVTTYAGKNQQGDNQPAKNAIVYRPSAIATRFGDTFIRSDGSNNIRKINGETGIINTIHTFDTYTFNIHHANSQDWIYIIQYVSRKLVIHKIHIQTSEYQKVDEFAPGPFNGNAFTISSSSMNALGDIAFRACGDSFLCGVFVYSTSQNNLTHVMGKGDYSSNPCEKTASDPLECNINVNSDHLALADDGNIYLEGVTNTNFGLWVISNGQIKYLRSSPVSDIKFLAMDPMNGKDTLLLATDYIIYLYNITSDVKTQLTGGDGSGNDGDPAIEADIRVYSVGRTLNDFAIIFTEEKKLRKIDPNTGLLKTIAGSGADSFNNTDTSGQSAENLYFTNVDSFLYGLMIYSLERSNPALMYSIDKYGKTTNYPVPNDEERLSIAVHPIYGDLFYTTKKYLYKYNVANKQKDRIGNTNILISNTRVPVFGGDYVGLSVHQNEIYFADSFNHVIRKITSEGDVIVVAGTGVEGFSGDNEPALSASLSNPTHAIVDRDGDLYIADFGNNRVRKVSSSTGVITTVCGNGLPGSPDPDTISPISLAESVDGDSIYASDFKGFYIKKIDKTSNTSTIIAGQGFDYDYAFSTVDALNAAFQPLALIAQQINSKEVIFFIDTNGAVKKLEDGKISAVAGYPFQFQGDIPKQGQARSIPLRNPIGLVFDPLTSDLYVSTLAEVRKITPDGQSISVCGNGTFGFFDTGVSASEATIYPRMMVMKDRNLFFSNLLSQEFQVNNIRYFSLDSSSPTVNTLVGGLGDGLDVQHTFFSSLRDIKFDSNGNLYLLENYSRIRKLTAATGIVSTIAGTGRSIKSNIVATDAFFFADSFTVINEDELLIPDKASNRIIRVSKGMVTTIVGNYTRGNPDFALSATETSITDPSGCYQTPNGEIIFSHLPRVDIYNQPTIQILKLDKFTGKLQELKMDTVISQPNVDDYRIELMRKSYGEMFLADPSAIYKLNPYCTTGKLNEFKTSCTNECFGIADETLGCSGNGYCVGQDQCSCFNNYNGTKCEDYTCNSISKSQSNVCSGRGSCTGYNVCQCNGGYSGQNCEMFTCSGVLNDMPNVCNGNGKCIDYDNCTCKKGYYGDFCENFDCFGYRNDNSSVCSAQGYCLQPDSCTCIDEFYGNTCQYFYCYGKGVTNNTVCSGNGVCLYTDMCDCKKGYYGDQCENYECFNVRNDNSTVCSSQGLCSSPNNCTCKNGYYGSQCELFNCKGIKSTDPTVCSSRGRCIAPDTCKCSAKNSFGLNCEFVATPSLSLGKINTTAYNSSVVAGFKSGRLNSGNISFTSLWLFTLILIKLLAC